MLGLASKDITYSVGSKPSTSPYLMGDQKRVEMLCRPCILGGPQCQAQGTKSEVAASPLPSRGPKRGRKCYVSPAFLWVPEQGFKKGLH